MGERGQKGEEEQIIRDKGVNQKEGEEKKKGGRQDEKGRVYKVKKGDGRGNRGQKKTRGDKSL